MIQGKGYFIWKAITCSAGRPQVIADAAFAAGLGHVLIKIADGTGRYNVSVDLPAIVAALQALGIEVWGWQYIYGSSPAAEADRAISQIAATGVTGFVVNAEREFKYANMGVVARYYMQRLRKGVGNLPIALSTYRYPSLHAPFPFNQFLEFCDIAMPQVYWLYSHDPIQQLAKTLAEYGRLTVVRPIIPTGAAWKQNGWQSTPADVDAFLQAAEMAGCTAANFWSWDASQNLPTWQAIATYDWPPEGAPEPEIPEEDMGEVLDKVNQVLENQVTILENQGTIKLRLAEIQAKLEADPEPEPEPPPAPPAPVFQVRVIEDPRTNAFVQVGKNVKNFPILAIYEDAPGRRQFKKGDVVDVSSLVPLDPDGKLFFYPLATIKGRLGEKLYVRTDEVEPV